MLIPWTGLHAHDITIRSFCLAFTFSPVPVRQYNKYNKMTKSLNNKSFYCYDYDYYWLHGKWGTNEHTRMRKYHQKRLLFSLAQVTVGWHVIVAICRRKPCSHWMNRIESSQVPALATLSQNCFQSIEPPIVIKTNFIESVADCEATLISSMQYEITSNFTF